jgi:hypothetical protein
MQFWKGHISNVVKFLNGLNWWLEVHPSKHQDHGQNKMFLRNIERKLWIYCDEFTVNSGGLSSMEINTYYIMWKWIVNLRADVKATEKILETMNKLSVEENSLPEPIFHMDENCQFWTWMPESTFIHK